MTELDAPLELAVPAAPLEEAYSSVAESYRQQKTQAARREVGQFWTPDPIADFMCRWLAAGRPRNVLDPGTGPGTFLRFLLHYLPTSSIIGVEKDEGLATSTRSLLSSFPQIKIFADDFLCPHRTWPKMGPFDGIVCNPPYVRHHLLGTYKNSARLILESDLGVEIPRKSGCFVYFFYQALRVLAPGGLLAFITPRLLFDAIYSRTIKQFVAAHLQVHAILTFGARCRIFDEVETAPLIILLEKPSGTLPKGFTTKLLSMDTWPGATPVLDALTLTKCTKLSWGSVEILRSLDPTARWTTPLILPRQDLPRVPLVPLREIARCVRGIATGANRFFTQSEEELRARNLPRSIVRPIVPMMRNAQRVSFTGEDWKALVADGKRCWLVSLDEGSTRDPAVKKYLAWGRRRQIHKRSLVQTRRRWYTMERRSVPTVLFPLLTQGTPRFVLNEAQVLALNVFHLIYPGAPFAEDPVAQKALVVLLNSPFVLGEVWRTGRTYGGRTIKLEPSELGQLMLPDPRRLSARQLSRLADLFDAVAGLPARDAQNQIEAAIGKILNKSRQDNGGRPIGSVKLADSLLLPA